MTSSALLPLVATAHVSPARTAAGAFVVLVVVPAFQLVAGAFFGRVAALVVGAVVALSTLALAVGPPPAVSLPPAQRYVPLSAVVRSSLVAPDSAAAQRVLAEGGKALVYVCLARGDASDVTVALNGSVLREAVSSGSADCWKRFEVPVSLWSGGPGALEVTATPRGTGVAELVVGYSPTRGERAFIELRIFARDGRLVEIWT